MVDGLWSISEAADVLGISHGNISGVHREWSEKGENIEWAAGLWVKMKISLNDLFHFQPLSSFEQEGDTMKQNKSANCVCWWVHLFLQDSTLLLWVKVHF